MMDDEVGWGKVKKHDKKDAIKAWARRVSGSSVAVFKVLTLSIVTCFIRTSQINFIVDAHEIR